MARDKSLVDPEMLAQKLRAALGQDTAAIHWEFTRKALEAATGVPTVVGVRAHLEQVVDRDGAAVGWGTR